MRAAFGQRLDLITRSLRQRREDRGLDKIHALYAPEVECIGKGEAPTRLEFGCNISLATTNRAAPGGRFVLRARTLPGTPLHWSHPGRPDQRTERIAGVPIERAHLDRGWRGQNPGDLKLGEADKTRVFLSGQKGGITPAM